jgi:serine/threonine-protein kinase RsbW
MPKPLTILVGDPPARPALVLERTWPSRLDLKQQIMDEIVDLLIGRGWVVEDDRAWLYLCFDEVVVNAMLHGNEGDPRLEVEIGVRVDEARWVVTVADQGDGFSESAIPDQSQPESLMLEHGRGIRIMQEWLDELAYYRGGSLAWLSRQRADRATPPPVSDPA